MGTVYYWVDGWMDTRIARCMDGLMRRWMCGLMDRQMDKRKDRQVFLTQASGFPMSLLCLGSLRAGSEWENSRLCVLNTMKTLKLRSPSFSFSGKGSMNPTESLLPLSPGQLLFSLLVQEDFPVLSQTHSWTEMALLLCSITLYKDPVWATKPLE